MTTSKSTEVARRNGLGRKPRTIASEIGERLLARSRELGVGSEWTWPSPAYQTDPVRFCREVLGIEPWDKQIELMESVIPPCSRVVVKSGNKCGKSVSVVCLALWFYCSFHEARVVMSSTTDRQVNQILWRQLRILHLRARTGIKPTDPALMRNPKLRTRDIGGEPKGLARSGLKSPDFREITGYTAKEQEAIAGISGENILYIVDEASGVPQIIFDAIKGNMAAGARLLMISNPTKPEGEFFDAFGKLRKSDTNPDGYTCISINSFDSPNVIAGEDLIPGLATRRWIEQMKYDYGEDSDWFRIRVKGEFAINEAARIIPLSLVLEAEERWADTLDEGLLHIGLDPAGPSGGGDESVFCLRRGSKILSFIAMREQSEDALLVHLLGILRENKRANEVPVVIVDREGLVGAKVFGALRGYLGQHAEHLRPFHLVGVRSSEKARRDPANFDRVRDELHENTRQWLRNGGAIPPDVKLENELHAAEWETRIDLKRKATPKDELRKILGRSPDRADAMALAVWEVSTRDMREVSVARAESQDRYTEPASMGIDPYDAERAWRG